MLSPSGLACVPTVRTATPLSTPLQDISNLLEGYGIDDVDIAYRELEIRPLASPILYGPVNNVHPLKGVIDWITTALSLPIAGLRTCNMQGTLGFYFTIGEDLYDVPARHVLFPDEEGNDAYGYSTCTFVSSVSFQKISGILTTPPQPLQRNTSSSWATERSMTSLRPFGPLSER